MQEVEADNCGAGAKGLYKLLVLEILGVTKLGCGIHRVHHLSCEEADCLAVAKAGGIGLRL